MKKYAFSGWDVLSYFGLAKHYVDSPSKRDKLFMHNLRGLISSIGFAGNFTGFSGGSFYPNKVSLVSEVIELEDDYAKDRCALWREAGIYPEASWTM